MAARLAPGDRRTTRERRAEASVHPNRLGAMLRFREADVTDADAHALLEAYFAERAAGFPVEQGVYAPTWPASAQFTPPAGVFLVADDDDDAAVGCGGGPRIQRRAGNKQGGLEGEDP